MEIKNIACIHDEINGKLHQYFVPESDIGDVYTFLHRALSLVMARMEVANQQVMPKEENQSVEQKAE